MHSSMLLGAVLAIGCVAVPLDARAVDVVDVLDVVTVTVTSGHLPPTPAPVKAPAPVKPAPKPVETTAAPATNNGGGFLEHPAPAPAPAKAPSSGNSGPSDGGILDVVNNWRQKYNLNTLTWNTGLAGNVQQVGQNNGGVGETHTLMSGVAMGQTIIPGQAPNSPSVQGYSPFEIAYLGWLCEVPSNPPLQPGANNGVNVCSVAQGALHMEYNGDTGHNAILTSPDYTGIFCDFAANPSASPGSMWTGIWICDLSQ